MVRSVVLCAVAGLVPVLGAGPTEPSEKPARTPSAATESREVLIAPEPSFPADKARVKSAPAAPVPTSSVPTDKPAAKPVPPVETVPDAALRADAGPAEAVPAGEFTPCPHCGQGQWIAPDCPEHGPGRRRVLSDWLHARTGESHLPLSHEESWLYRPVNAGLFFGLAVGSELMQDWAGQETGGLGGLRVGWDFDPYWGVELRYAVGNIRVTDGPLAIATAEELYNATGMVFSEQTRYSGRNLLDASLLFYPLGDVRLRPYLLFGVGYVSLRFDDLIGNHYSRTTLGMPFGVGAKYLWTDRLALRLELSDTVILGGENIQTVHDVSLNGGLEVRFGGPRRSYWPWNPGDRYW